MTSKNNTRFNAEAAAWDSNPDVHAASDEALKALLARIPSLHKDKDNSNTPKPRVLEIGCGTGLLSYRLSPYVSSLLAVDASEGMIAALEQKLSQPDAPTNIHPLCIMLEDPEDTRLPPASESGTGSRQKYDLIVSHLTLHHIPDMAPLLHTMLGCLRPGGLVALTDFEDFGPEARKFHPESKMDGVERHGINRGQMETLMQEVGFVNVDVQVAWTMRKDVEAFPGEWGEKKPSVEERGGKELAEMDFPFLVMMGCRA